MQPGAVEAGNVLGVGRRAHLQLLHAEGIDPVAQRIQLSGRELSGQEGVLHGGHQVAQLARREVAGGLAGDQGVERLTQVRVR